MNREVREHYSIRLISIETSFDLFRIRAEPIVVIMSPSKALRCSLSLLVHGEREDVRPRVVAGKDVNFVVVVVDSLCEFYKATADCNIIQ
jgi:hypothetical protein